MSERATARRDLLATTAILAAFFAAIALPAAFRRLGPHPSVAECDALLDRYVAYVARAENPAITPAEVDRARFDARARAVSLGELARCAEEASAAGLSCAMQAGGADEVERCLQ